MGDRRDDVQAEPAPDLGIPHSDNIVQVSIIDTTCRLANVKAETLVKPIGHRARSDSKAQIGSFTKFEHGIPAYSFLIENKVKGQTILYDLGIAKNWLTKYPPQLVERQTKVMGWNITIEKDVIEILQDHGLDPVSVNAIVWSHHHFDHLGDPSLFPGSTVLVVGPGFKKEFVPGYPTNPDCRVSEMAWQGRELHEVDFTNNGELNIGGYAAYDYFGDGSFYLLDTPGHAIGHICGLARTTADPTSFLFMGGDAAHHGSEYRPTKYLPLPKEIRPHPLQEVAAKVQMVCPGEVFQELHPMGSSTEPFTEPDGGYNFEACIQSIRKMEGFDAHENVFSVIAHDHTLLDVLEYYPQTANDWKAKGWKQKGLWRFLGDFINKEERDQLLKNQRP